MRFERSCFLRRYRVKLKLEFELRVCKTEQNKLTPAGKGQQRRLAEASWQNE